MSRIEQLIDEIEEYVEGLVPKDLDKPLLVRPNIEKHPETFVTKLLLKL